MIIGAQKSGTTSLAAQLANHPQISFSRVKEPGYFSATADWEAKIDGYHQLFDPVSDGLYGEGSTMYTFLPETPETCERIHAYNPDMKLIYIMRQPVDRLISQYSHGLARGVEQRPPHVAVVEDPRYVNYGRYGVQIRPYIELFGRENILLLIFEEYITGQTATLNEVAGFLGISEHGFQQPEEGRQNKSVGVPHMKYASMERFTQTGLFRNIRDYVPEEIRHTIRYRLLSNKLDAAPVFEPELRETLWRFLADDVTTIENLLGRSLPAWRKGPES